MAAGRNIKGITIEIGGDTLEKPGKRLRKQPESSRTYMPREWETPWTLYQMQS